MITPFEKTFLTRLHAVYQKKADELVNGGVPDDRYRAHATYLLALRDVFKEIENTRKDLQEQ